MPILSVRLGRGNAAFGAFNEHEVSSGPRAHSCMSRTCRRNVSLRALRQAACAACLTLGRHPRPQMHPSHQPQLLGGTNHHDDSSLLFLVNNYG
jgi:hypothetical protein